MTRGDTAAAGSPGFTLIEVLVVLLIMGLLVGLASVIVRPDDRGLLRVEAERLAQLLDLAVAESRYAGQPMAWTADGQSYRFWRMTADTGWSEVRDSDLLRARTLPQGMIFAGMQVENRPVSGVMRLEFTPYGPPLSFNIDMSFGTAHFAVAGSPIGEVRVLPDEGVSSGTWAPR